MAPQGSSDTGDTPVTGPAASADTATGTPTVTAGRDRSALAPTGDSNMPATPGDVHSRVGTPPVRRSKRRPKPVRFTRRVTIRADADLVSAVEDVADAVEAATSRRPSFSSALRTLVVRNSDAARAMAGSPDSWPTTTAVQLPQRLWDALSEASNRLSHCQGSLYGILRAMNSDSISPSRAEWALVMTAVRETQEAVTRLEQLAVEYVAAAPAAPGISASSD